jgi:type II secretory pathway pseudopilin PulG
MISHPDEAGYTMVEAAVTLALLSLLGGAIAAFSFGGLRALERARAASASAGTLARMEEALGREAGRVRVPYWDRGARLKILAGDEGYASMPCFDGVRNMRLKLSWGGGRFVISTPEGSESFAPVESVSVSALPAPEACPRGLEVDFSMRGRKYAIEAHFGGAAIPAATEN